MIFFKMKMKKLHGKHYTRIIIKLLLQINPQKLKMQQIQSLTKLL